MNQPPRGYTNEFKICLSCGNKYYKKIHIASSTWTLRQYCSHKCAQKCRTKEERLRSAAKAAKRFFTLTCVKCGVVLTNKNRHTCVGKKTYRCKKCYGIDQLTYKRKRDRRNAMSIEKLSRIVLCLKAKQDKIFDVLEDAHLFTPEQVKHALKEEAKYNNLEKIYRTLLRNKEPSYDFAVDPCPYPAKNNFCESCDIDKHCAVKEHGLVRAS